MSMYYLHRNGSTTGPFAPGRLRQMWTAGEVGPSDMVCEHGTEEWLDAEAIAMPMFEEMRERERTAWIRASYPYGALAAVIWILSLAVMILSLFIPLLWFLPIPLIVAACFANPARYHCSACGNRLEKSSAVCPSCQSIIVPAKGK